MKNLDIKRINERSPYTVWQDGDELKFWSDHNILFVADFDFYEPWSGIVTYWFNLINRSHKPSPNDPKVRQTIICIVEEFFRANPDILLYMCDTANEQQSMRARLFLHWFNSYEQQGKYVIRTTLLKDEGVENYIAFIIQRSHPRCEEIINLFDKEVGLIQEAKP